MQDKTAVRRLSLESLVEAEENDRFIDETVAKNREQLDGRDRRLFQEICFGATRHRNTIDRILKPFLRMPMRKQRPILRWALRVGVYQLVYLTRVPAHAAVNQTVESVKAGGGAQRDAGFVNAILQNVSREIHKKTDIAPDDRNDLAVLPIRGGFCKLSRPLLPNARLHLVDHLSVKYSHPVWLVERWLERFGEEELRQLLEHHNRTPALTARLTSRAPSIEEVVQSLAENEIEAEAGPDGMITITRSGDLGETRPVLEGWIQFQDHTAFRVGAALAPPANSRVLDLCAAPGGKASQQLEAVGPEGHVVAADRSESKLELVRENLSKLGDNFTATLVSDDPSQTDLGETFRHILVDAPCSNTGVLARRPDARWRLDPDELGKLARLQTALLECAYRHLEPGGRLLYSTCSIEPEENEERIADFVGQHPDLTELESKLFLPHRAGADGGYYTVLRRERA